MTDEQKLPDLIQSGFTASEISRKLSRAKQTVMGWAKKLSPELQSQLKNSGRQAQKKSNRQWNAAYGVNIRKTVSNISDNSSVGSGC